MDFALFHAFFHIDSPLNLWAAAVLAVILDRLLGEPRRWHPLVGFGRLAGALEAKLNPQADCESRATGMLAWMLAVLPWVGLAAALRGGLPGPWAFALDVYWLYFALGARSLAQHAQAVSRPLAQGDLPQARLRVSYMVSRDTASLDASGIAKAGVETVLENGNDAVFGALFWFLLLGGPGALLFRLANTLDAMWGYRTPRFFYFGWAAARIDDALNYLPARLTALSYALLGQTKLALSCWRQQAPTWDSPNAGPVMAAGAGSLALALGGAAQYHGREEVRPPLGAGACPAAADIDRAVTLVQRGMLLWLGLAGLICLLISLGSRHA